jgi:inorganic pyrophosphatase
MFKSFFFTFAIFGIAYGQFETTEMFETTTSQDQLVSSKPDEYVTIEKMQQGGERYYLQQPAGRYISIWHDIPLFADQQNNIYNMVVEVPRGEIDSLEANLALPMNPIMEKIDNAQSEDEPIDHIHNYGFIPQTFLNSSEIESVSQLHGNNKPIKVVEIGDNFYQVGAVIQVKILGALGVIDGESIDYKLVGVDVRSSLAQAVNDLDDLEKRFPDLLGATRGFFRYYKYPLISDIAFNGQYQDSSFAEKIIDEAHQSWNQLIRLPTMPQGFSTDCHVEGAAFPADDAEWFKIASLD